MRSRSTTHFTSTSGNSPQWEVVFKNWGLLSRLTYLARLYSAKFYRIVYKILPLDQILKSVNPVHSLTFCFFPQIHFNSIPPLLHASANTSVAFRFLKQIHILVFNLFSSPHSCFHEVASSEDIKSSLGLISYYLSPLSISLSLYIKTLSLYAIREERANRDHSR